MAMDESELPDRHDRVGRELPRYGAPSWPSPRPWMIVLFCATFLGFGAALFAAGMGLFAP